MPAADIVALKPGKAAVNETLVGEVRKLLAQVERGEVVALADAAARRDHARICCYQPSDGYYHDLIAGVFQLSHHVGKTTLDAPEVEDL